MRDSTEARARRSEAPTFGDLIAGAMRSATALECNARDLRDKLTLGLRLTPQAEELLLAVCNMADRASDALEAILSAHHRGAIPVAEFTRPLGVITAERVTRHTFAEQRAVFLAHRVGVEVERLGDYLRLDGTYAAGGNVYASVSRKSDLAPSETFVYRVRETADGVELQRVGWQATPNASIEFSDAHAEADHVGEGREVGR